MKRLRFLMLAILLLAPFQALRADMLQEVVIRGWTDTKAGKHVHYEIHITYTPVKSYLSKVTSLEVTIGKQKVVFPSAALDESSCYWETPRGLYALYNDKNEFGLFFKNCGDGARTYSLDFTIRDGRLVSCRVTPGEMSEVERAIVIFDARGRVTYRGPCDEQGNPTPKTKKK